MTNPTNWKMTLPPGGVLVVGPNGNFDVKAQGDWVAIEMNNCDFIGPGHMTEAHRALVDERWAVRTETGCLINDEPATLPPSIESVFQKANSGTSFDAGSDSYKYQHPKDDKDAKEWADGFNAGLKLALDIISGEVEDSGFLESKAVLATRIKLKIAANRP